MHRLLSLSLSQICANCTVELENNKGPRDWQNVLNIMKSCYIKVLFHIHHMLLLLGSRISFWTQRTLLYRGLLYRGSTVDIGPCSNNDNRFLKIKANFVEKKKKKQWQSNMTWSVTPITVNSPLVKFSSSLNTGVPLIGILLWSLLLLYLYIILISVMFFSFRPLNIDIGSSSLKKW